MSELIAAANQAVQEFVTYDGALTVALMEYADAKAAGNTSKMNQLAAEIQTNKLRAQQAQLSAQNAIDSARSEPGANGSTFDSVSQANQDQFRTITKVFNQELKYLNKNISQADAIDASPNSSGEAQTNEEKNALEAQGTSNEPGDIPVDTADPTVNRSPDFRQRELPDEDRSDAASIDVDAEIERAAAEGTDQSDEPANRENGLPGTRRVTPASAQWSGVKDTRVILRTPKSYFGKLTSGPGSEIQKNGGILFPYTPSISYDNQASYGNSNPLHSNYTQYFFKNSSISSITVSGKFTVQNEYDAKMWLSIVHLSRLLTKMPFGSDAQAGSAPPVCRLDGFGNYVLANVPVAVTSFKFDLPDSVDYINVSDGDFINSMAPTVSTLSFTLIPMYSRNEIRNFSVEKFRDGQLTGKGYL
jgi:hypothetical protein